jgi:5-methylcytosine-specific restriction enzyme A
MRFCATPACRALVTHGHCATHQPSQRQRYGRDPRYSSQRWARLSRRRRAVHPFCVRCDRVAEVTDHIVPVYRAPERFFDPTNHQSLCARCNREKAITE